MGCHEQECVTAVVEHRLCDVLAIVRALNEEVGIGRLLTVHHPLPARLEVCPHVVGTEVELG